MTELSAAEAELAVEQLLMKLERWIVAQPEAVLIWAQPRQTRKRMAEGVADLVTMIPTRENVEGNRDLRRRIIRQIEKENREWYRGIGVE